MSLTPEQIKWIPINELKPHPKNPNRHPEDQIARLADIIKFQGFRVPVIVSNQSGFIVAGHGRVLAAKAAGLTSVPVIYQDFSDSDQEYAFIVSDNGIGSWSDLDFSLINLELPELHLPSVELLGLKDFDLNKSDKLGSTELSESDFQNFQHTCPKCGFEYDDQD